MRLLVALVMLLLMSCQKDRHEPEGQHASPAAEGQASQSPKHVLRRWELDAAGGLPMPVWTAWQHLDARLAQQIQQRDQALQQALASTDRSAHRVFKISSLVYNSLINEYPDTVAMSYLLLQAGRAYLYDHKRNKARQLFADICDYFPDDADIAATALYLTGVSYLQESDEDLARKAFEALLSNFDYIPQPIAAYAHAQLAGLLRQKGKIKDAIAHDELIYSLSGPSRPGQALRRRVQQRLFLHYSIRDPNLGALISLYRHGPGFAGGLGAGDKLGKDAEILAASGFWSPLRTAITRDMTARRHRGDSNGARHLAKSWIQQIGGRSLPSLDGRIWQVQLQAAVDDDLVAARRRLMALRHSCQGASASLCDVRFLEACLPNGVWSGHDRAFKEFYNRLASRHRGPRIDSLVLQRFLAVALRADFVSFTNRQIIDHLQGVIALEDRDDAELAVLQALVRTYDIDWCRRCCQAMTDRVQGGFLELQAIINRNDIELADKLKLAEQLRKYARLRPDVHWLLARLHLREGRLPQAIVSFKASGRGQRALAAVAHCHQQMQAWDKAIAVYLQIENTYADPDAAVEAGYCYLKAGEPAKSAAQMKQVLMKYKDTAAATRAKFFLCRHGMIVD